MFLKLFSDYFSVYIFQVIKHIWKLKRENTYFRVGDDILSPQSLLCLKAFLS